MTSNLDLISDAYRQIGMLDQNESPSAELGQVGLRRLNQLMAAWIEPPSPLQFPSWFEQTDLSAPIPLPLYAHRAVTAALAVEIAGVYDRPVSEALAVIAANSYDALLVKRLNQQIQPIVADLPLGDGQVWPHDITAG